jgi:hypothetical protein
MKPNLVSFVPGQGVELVEVTRDVPGYGVNLAMSFAEECLTRWAQAKTNQEREKWLNALSPLPLELPWIEDTNEVIESARSREPHKPDAGYQLDQFDRDLNDAVKATRRPENLPVRAVGHSFSTQLPAETVAVLADEARKVGNVSTDGYVLEWLLGAATTAWGLARTRLGRGQASLEKGNETISGDGWTIRFEGSPDYLHVAWWLSWGAGNPSHGDAWEGANLEWLAACAPTEQLQDLMREVNKRRLAWLVQANRTYVRFQLAPLVAKYSDTSTGHKYRYIALFSKTPEQLRRTPKTAAVVAAIQRVTLEELTDRRLPAEVPEGQSPASVAKSGAGCGSVMSVAIAVAIAVAMEVGLFSVTH